MKTVKKSTYVLFMACLIFSSYQCSSPKQLTSPSNPEFRIDQVVFQEWYAGIKVGGTGFNIFLPNLINTDNLVLENVYFRNLSGELTEDKGKYSAVLRNPSPYYTWEYPEKPENYPFDLSPNECVISYRENGEAKYIRVPYVTEKAGVYYENGHPSIYKNTTSPVLATVDED